MNVLIVMASGAILVLLVLLSIWQYRRVLQKQRQLIDSVFHELASSLTVVRLTTELQKDQIDQGGVGGAHQAMTVDIDQEIEQMKQLMKNFLYVINHKQRRLSMEKRVCAVDAIIQRAITQVQPTAQLKHVTVVTATLEPAPVMGSAEDLFEAVNTLFQNMVRDMPANAQITINLTSARKVMTLAVQHTCLFWATYADRSLSSLFSFRLWINEPMNINLLMIKKIVAAHQGVMSLRSDSNTVGGTVIINLPLV